MSKPELGKPQLPRRKIRFREPGLGQPPLTEDYSKLREAAAEYEDAVISSGEYSDMYVVETCDEL